MVGYTCPIRSSQVSQTNDRSWNLAKYTKLLDGKEDVLTAESRLCVMINMSRRYLSVLSGKTTLEEMSLIGLPTPIVKTRDHDVFFRLSSHEGNVLTKFRIKFLTTLDRCAFTALLSNYVEVISADANRSSRTISQPTSQNDSSFLCHSQTQSQRESLPLGSCSQSSTSSYASMHSLLQSQSSQNTCSQNITQRSLTSSTFSSQPSQVISQSTNAFSQNTSAFSQPLSIFSQSTTGLSSSLRRSKSPFSNTKEANLSYEHDGRPSQKVHDMSFDTSCHNSSSSFTSLSQGFSRSDSLDREDETAFSQSNSTLFNATKLSAVGTHATHVESAIHSVATKLPTPDDQVVPSIDAENVLPSTYRSFHQTSAISSSNYTSRSSLYNTEFSNASSMANCAKRQHCEDGIGSLQIVPESAVDMVTVYVKDVGDDSVTVEGRSLGDAVGSEPSDIAQSIASSRVDAATQTNRQLTIDDLLKDDELLRKFVVERLKDPTFIAFQKRFSTAQLRQPPKKHKATKTRKNSDRKERERNWIEGSHV